MLEFGEKIPGKVYVDRPGAYAVIEKNGLYAVVKNPKSTFLIGGGIEGGETPEEALHREVMEEIGWTIRIDQKIGVALQHIYVPDVEVYISKECHFYRVTLLEQTGGPGEDTHELQWLSKAEALEKLLHESHRSALGGQALE